jgi:hypothetical protein
MALVGLGSSSHLRRAHARDEPVPDRGGEPCHANPNPRPWTSTHASASLPMRRARRSTRPTGISRVRYTPTRPKPRAEALRNFGALSRRTESCRTPDNANAMTPPAADQRRPCRDPRRSRTTGAPYAAEPEPSRTPAIGAPAPDTSLRTLPGSARRASAQRATPAGTTARAAAHAAAPATCCPTNPGTSDTPNPARPRPRGAIRRGHP